MKWISFCHTEEGLLNCHYSIVVVGTVLIILVDQVLLHDVVDRLVDDGVHPEANGSGDAMHERKSRKKL